MYQKFPGGWFFGVYVLTENKESLLTPVDDIGKQSHRTENDNGVTTEKYHSDFERFESDQLLETNIIGKHLNNKLENSNKRLLTEQCAFDLTSEFPCSAWNSVQEKEPTILAIKLQ